MAGWKDFANLEILTEEDIDGYLMGQVVPRFASTVERDAALGTPAPGQLCVVAGWPLTMYHSTAGWLPVGVVSYTTAGRPDAADVPTGTLIYDSTLGRLVHSNGSAWVESVSSVAGKTGAVTLVKADVGLSNVDNTADSAKPVSTAQQTALDAKLDKTGGTVTGTLVVSGTLSPGSVVSSGFGTFTDIAAGPSDTRSTVNYNALGVKNPSNGIAVVIRSHTTQTADLLQLQSSGGTVLARVQADGALRTAAFVRLDDQGSAPATPTAGGVIYCESGSLKFKGSSGTVTVIAPA